MHADALWRRPCNMTFACRHDSEQPEEAVAMMNVVETANADQRESNNQGFFLLVKKCQMIDGLWEP